MLLVVLLRKGLPKLYKEADEILSEKLDNLMLNFEGTDFFSEYEQVRIVVNQIRHTVIKGNVPSAEGADLNKVLVKFTAKDKVAGEEKATFEEMTNKDDNFVKSALNPELSYDLEFILPNFEPQKISGVELDRG